MNQQHDAVLMAVCVAEASSAEATDDNRVDALKWITLYANVNGLVCPVARTESRAMLALSLSRDGQRTPSPELARHLRN